MEKKNNPIVLLIIGVLLLAVGYYLGGLKKENDLLKKKNQPTVNQQVTQGAEDALSLKNLKKYGKEIGLDQKKFEKCLSDKKYADWIKESTDYGREMGVLGTPNFFINGKILGGAFPIENFKEIIDKELNGTGSTDITTYSKELQDAAKQGAFNPEVKDVEIKSNIPVKGNKDAKVTIVEFSDPSCPFCAKAALTIKDLFKEYDENIKRAFYYFPGHGTGEEAMQAMMCAGDQNKFWEMHDKVFGANAKALGITN